MKTGPLLLFLAAVLVPGAALSQEGIVLETGGVAVEMIPSPAGLSFLFRESGGTPLDVSALQTRVVLRADGGPPRELALHRKGRANHLASALDLGETDSFTAVLLFEHRGESHVLRFPPASPWPPFVTDALPHEEVAHDHVTPHDGFVEVFGDNHAELSLEEGCLRLFWYDVAMNQIPAAGVTARCHLAPCDGGPQRLEMRPPAQKRPEAYLEAKVPAPCGEATGVTLMVEREGESRTFRYRLPMPLAEYAMRVPPPLGGHTLFIIDPDSPLDQGYTVEFRRTAPGARFPAKESLEARILDLGSLAPVDSRQVPAAHLVTWRGLVPLPPLRRLAAPGRWRLEAWVPAGAWIDFSFTSPEGIVVEAGLSTGGRAWRSAHPVWLAACLAAGLLFAVWCALPAKRPWRIDLVPLLGLGPLVRSPYLRAFLPILVLGLLLIPLLAVLFLGPRETSANPAAWLLLGLLLPAVLLSPILKGRVWCAWCPLPALSDLVRDTLGRGRRIPASLYRWRRWLVPVQLLLAAVLALAVPVASPLVGAFLLICLAAAAAMALVWEKRPFCGVACPLGGLLGLFEAASPLRLEPEGRCRDEEEGGEPCPWTDDPGRWSALTASCCHCGQGAGGSPSILLRRPFPEARGDAHPAAGPEAYVLWAAVLLFFSRHPWWCKLPGPSLLPWGTFLAIVVVLALARAASPVRGTWRPLAFFAVAAWALPLLLSALAGLPSIAAALISLGEAEVSVSPPLPAGVMLAVQLGLLLSGTVLSVLAAWRGGGGVRAALPPAAAAALVGGILAGMAATSFHLALPLALVS